MAQVGCWQDRSGESLANFLYVPLGTYCRYGIASTHKRQAEKEKGKGREKKGKRKGEKTGTKSNKEPALYNTNSF
jgi:hypothetical protein